MMKHWLFSWGLCLLLGYLHSGAAIGAAQAQAANSRPTGWIVAMQGKVSLWPNGQRKNEVTAQLCMEFRWGDLLAVAKGAQATVACAGLQKPVLASGVHGLPCRPGNKVLGYNGSQVMPTRSDTWDAGFPQLLSPRKTKLLSARPILRWTPVAGATAYQVSLLRNGRVIWSATANSITELVYPEDAPKLLAGETYKLRVAAGDCSPQMVIAGNCGSDQEGLPDLGFTLLKLNQAKAVRKAEGKIRQLGLPDTPTRFLIAQLYAAAGLNAEAIELLQGFSDAAHEPAPALELGNLYLTIGLNRPAQQSYLRALELAEQAQEMRTQARAQYALGRIYDDVLNNKDETVKRWLKARELYQQLGDAKMVKKLQATLAGLQK